MTTSTLQRPVHSPLPHKAIELRIKIGGLLLAAMVAMPLLMRLHG